MQRNLDVAVVEHFGREWSAYNQRALDPLEAERIFNAYFRVFPWHVITPQSTGFDLGCGSGRWARLMAPRVGWLHCIDPSAQALNVARTTLARTKNCSFHCAAVDALPLADDSMDFGYALGVLHHVPDTAAGLRACVRKLRPGAPLLVYLYYAFDNRPHWYRTLWSVSDLLRRALSHSPWPVKQNAVRLLAALIYLPAARAAALLERLGVSVAHWPLAAYRQASFYTMQTDALDRFGTAIEQRFTRARLHSLLEDAGLERLRFSDQPPFWCVAGFRGA